MGNDDLSGFRRLVLYDEGPRHYGVPVPAVLRVVRMVALTPVPEAPRGVLGVLNMHGRVVPVLSLNERFGIGSSAGFQHQLILAQTGACALGLVAHEVNGVVECRSSDLIPAARVLPTMRGLITEVLKQGGNLVLIPDLDLLLSTDDQVWLNEATEVPV
jgi:purine-binding chemotaxis protein CheW